MEKKIKEAKQWKKQQDLQYLCDDCDVTVVTTMTKTVAMIT